MIEIIWNLTAVLTKPNLDTLTKDTTILVDLDMTLIATNTANNHAYQQAFFEVCKQKIHAPYPRITSAIIKQQLGTRHHLFNQIVKRKKFLYAQFLSLTYVNQDLSIFLLNAGEICPIYLVSKGKLKRITATLNYHCLKNIFTGVFCCQSHDNKYQLAIDRWELNPQKIIVFENDPIEIQHAVFATIPKNQIFHIDL